MPKERLFADLPTSGVAPIGVERSGSEVRTSVAASAASPGGAYWVVSQRSGQPSG